MTVPALCFPMGSANTAHPTPISHSTGVSPTRPGQSTLQSVGAAMSCWLGGRAEQGFSSSCRSQLQPQAMLDTGITLLLWPDAMHEELRFQQASASWTGSFRAEPRGGGCSPVLGGLPEHLCQKPTFC